MSNEDVHVIPSGSVVSHHTLLPSHTIGNNDNEEFVTAYDDGFEEHGLVSNTGDIVTGADDVLVVCSETKNVMTGNDPVVASQNIRVLEDTDTHTVTVETGNTEPVNMKLLEEELQQQGYQIIGDGTGNVPVGDKFVFITIYESMYFF